VGYQQRLLSVVRRVLSRRVGVLAVLHDLNLAAAFADRVYLLDDGRSRAEGAPGAVIRPEFINPVYAAELDVRRDADTGRPLVLPLQAPF
jgi:iron complex transport system ATP-binding protein